MRTRRVLFVSLSTILATLLLSVVLNANRDTATAQGPNPSTGDSPPPTAVPLAPSGDGQNSGEPNRPAPQREAAPDTPSNPALSFSYYHVSGTLFQPRKSASTYDYSSNGCIFQTGGTDFRFQAHLLVPDGSVVKYVRIYFLDTAAQDMTVWLTEYDDGTSATDLTSVSSSGNAAGARSVLSPLITHTVDLANYAYVLSWGTGVLGNGNQICGVRVAYYAPPVFGLFAPLIQKNP